MRYIQHWLRSGHRNGHGIHSPYVYDLVRNVVFNKAGMEADPVSVSYHRKLKTIDSWITVHDLGAGSSVEKGSSRSISSIARYSSVTMKNGALLYRIARWYKPAMVIEFGTGLGISTSYLATGAGDVPFVSMEGSSEKQAFALKHNAESGNEHVKMLLGDFDRFLDTIVGSCINQTLVFIDGDHRYKPTLDKVDRFLGRSELSDMILILDDIHWSTGMEQAWRECANRKEVAISIDLFYYGLLIVRPGIEKQHFRVKY